MCGIAGMVGEVDAGLLRRMLESLRHRGPDDLGMYVDDRVAMGQSRLSIIDVAGGHQPIFDEEDERCIVANGEIYNYRSLGKDLEKHAFRTRSDSEVPLHLYEDLGPDVASRLDGMFALAIWDAGSLYLARDPVGIKPLYYANEDGTFYFASEIKALLHASKRVREFPNGHWYRPDRGFQPFVRWETEVRQDWGADGALARLRELLPRAVSKRLMSDVPLGTFCSGGLDSTLVTALAARELETFHTFSTGMPGAPDLESARRASEFLGTEHHIREFTEEDVMKALPTVAYHLESYDAALFRSAVPTFFVSELARKYVKVVLTGEGADELYAGYRYLKNLPFGPPLHDELVRITRALHHVNLQRTDRMTMAHSLEARVPYLDWQHVSFALTLPTHLKVHGTDRVEKWLLRKAFPGLLPDDLLWRGKQKFAEGTGSFDVVRRVAERQITDAEFEKERERIPTSPRTKEELYCYRLFEEQFELPPDIVNELVGTTAVY
ncbi:MAG TPA: asparagine synthase B [Thermoplasmata archaeon]|nr:asparagine synthase B [Thermoplasmata archaeon]